ncbi:transposase [Embleya hyalina]|uniref:transposase n=1 Tax=Embleya hyalina TaxID=516124 RepID=UPI003530BC45
MSGRRIRYTRISRAPDPDRRARWHRPTGWETPAASSPHSSAHSRRHGRGDVEGVRKGRSGKPSRWSPVSEGVRIVVGPRAVRRGTGGPRPSRAAAEAGRSTGHPRREIPNALSYRLPACCAWRLPRHDFSPYRTVHRHGRRWRTEGRSGAIPGAPGSGNAPVGAVIRPQAPGSWTAEVSRKRNDGPGQSRRRCRNRARPGRWTRRRRPQRRPSPVPPGRHGPTCCASPAPGCSPAIGR